MIRPTHRSVIADLQGPLMRDPRTRLPITNVYVDGFNLYFGALKGTAYKWLDLEALCAKLLPYNDVRRIRYCTARIKARPGDLQGPARQQAYLDALGSLSTVSVHLGHFLESRVRMRLANPFPGGPNTVEVIKSEEKGSDVNLATWLLVDAYEESCETAVLVTNDSDLASVPSPPVNCPRESSWVLERSTSLRRGKPRGKAEAPLKAGPRTQPHEATGGMGER